MLIKNLHAYTYSFMHIYATIEPYLILSIQNKLDKLPNKRGIKTNSTK